MTETAAPRGPFGATVDGVIALVPTARLLDDTAVPVPVPTGGLEPGRGGGTFAVSVSTVAAWVEELSARLALRLDGWQRLTATPVAPETTSDRDQLVAFARDLVHNGAASYLEAARYPERSAAATTSYAAVLWARFESGLADLSTWLERRLEDGTDVADAPALAGVPAASFPPPRFLDSLVF